MAQVWETPLTPTEKLVLLALADCANDTGECWPSIATIGRKAGVGERTVQRSIQSMKDAGHLTRREITGRGCRYYIHPRHSGTPAELSPVTPVSQPPPQSHPTPATVAPKPSKKHQEPSKEIVPAVGEAPITLDELVEDWNTLAKQCGLPTVAKLTDRRRRQALARIRQYPELDAWQKAFASIRGSPWMHGQNDKGWRADFDFLLQDKSFTRLVEGSYGQT